MLERAGAAPVLAALRGTGPWKGIPVAPADAVTGVTGKAVVHAREAGAAADFTVLSDTVQVADVPAVGTPLRRGGPVCTVLAEAADASACLAALRAGAARVYDALRRTAIE